VNYDDDMLPPPPPDEDEDEDSEDEKEQIPIKPRVPVKMSAIVAKPPEPMPKPKPEVIIEQDEKTAASSGQSPIANGAYSPTPPPPSTEAKAKVTNSTLQSRSDMSTGISQSSLGVMSSPLDTKTAVKEEKTPEKFSAEENKNVGGRPGILMPPTSEELEKEVEPLTRPVDKKLERYRKKPNVQDAGKKADKAGGMKKELQDLLKWAQA